MDFKNYVILDMQVGGYVFEFKMPAGCTFAAAHQAASQIAGNIETLSKQAEEQQKAQAEAAPEQQVVETPVDIS